MNRQALALSWELLARHRWMTAATVALLLLGGLASLLDAPLALLVWAMISWSALALAMLSHGAEGRMEGRAGLFPRRLFVLPVSTWGLVLPPMLLTSGVLLASGALMTVTGLPPWPALLVANVAAWMQALMWTPMPLPWLRLAAVMALPPVVLGAGVMAPLAPPGVAVVALSGVLALAYPAAWAGVSLSRRGVGVSEPAVEIVATRERAPFASPGEALRWYEWRSRWGQVAVAASLPLLGLPIMLLITIASRKSELLLLPPFGPLVEAVGPGWLAAAAGLAIPVWTALFGGGDLGRLGERDVGTATSPFQTAKPVGDEVFLAAKYRLATGVVLIQGAVAWLLIVVYTAAVGEWPGMAERVGYWFGSPWAALAVVPGLMAGVFVLLWLWTARALWAGLWTSQAAMIGPVACGFLVPAGLLSGHLWLSALGLAAEAASLAFLARHSPRRRVIALTVAVCFIAAWNGWWPVVLLGWPWAGLLLAPTALSRNRHR